MSPSRGSDLVCANDQSRLTTRGRWTARCGGLAPWVIWSVLMRPEGLEQRLPCDAEQFVAQEAGRV